METRVDFSSYLSQFFSDRDMFRAIVEKEMKTHILGSIFLNIRVVYEIMWENMVQPDGLHINLALALCILDT